MELAFEKNAVDHLQKLVCQVVSQEETAETVVPDSLPDVGRIVGCWGVPVVRSKEWRQNGMGVSGGVSAWVLYVPEEGERHGRWRCISPSPQSGNSRRRSKRGRCRFPAASRASMRAW